LPLVATTRDRRIPEGLDRARGLALRPPRTISSTPSACGSSLRIVC